MGGRAYFVNAGRTRNKGIEAGLGATPLRRLAFNAAYTWAHYTFTEYRVKTGTVVDTLDGNRLAGVPEHFLRIGIRAGPVAGLTADLDQILSSALYADDRNTLQVDGWGAGVTNLRLGWSGNAGALRLAPFVSVFNLFDRRYVGSVTINGVMAPGVTIGEAIEFIEAEASRVFPREFSYDYVGESRQFKQHGSALVLTFFLSIAVIYLVLGSPCPSAPALRLQATSGRGREPSGAPAVPTDRLR